MSRTGFESAIPTTKRPQTYALDRVAIGMSFTTTTTTTTTATDTTTTTTTTILTATTSSLTRVELRCVGLIGILLDSSAYFLSLCYT
jgi:hypothetical protein